MSRKHALLVVDTETGGLDPTVACIIEIAAQVLIIEPGRLVPGEAYLAKVTPDRPVHPKAAAVNGYTPERWGDAWPLDEGLADFGAWVDRQAAAVGCSFMWTGSNPHFDLRFLKSDCTRHGVGLPASLSYRVIDTTSLCLPLLLRGEVDGLGLAKLRTWAGCPGEQAHGAEQDVIDTCTVLHTFAFGGAS